MRPEYAFTAFVLLLLLSGCAQQNEQMTQEKAVGLVEEHMKVNYKGALTSVYLVEKQDDSWKITAKVVYGANTPCPNLSTVVYEYPKFGFVTRGENNMTSDCRVLACEGISNCEIAMDEEAIIASHKLNDVPEVNSFITQVGYANVNVGTIYYNSYFEPKTNTTYPFVWIVTWTSPKANYSIRLILNQTGGKVLDKFVE